MLLTHTTFLFLCHFLKTWGIFLFFITLQNHLRKWIQRPRGLKSSLPFSFHFAACDWDNLCKEQTLRGYISPLMSCGLAGCAVKKPTEALAEKLWHQAGVQEECVVSMPQGPNATPNAGQAPQAPQAQYHLWGGWKSEGKGEAGGRVLLKNSYLLWTSHEHGQHGTLQWTFYLCYRKKINKTIYISDL